MTIDLTIEKNVYGGDALAHLGDGRVCFVPGAFAGERVRAEITQQKRHFVRAKLIELVEALPTRLENPTPSVPGMVYAPIAYKTELELKRDQLVNFMQKLTHQVLPVDVIACEDHATHYRNKVVYHLQKKGTEFVMGYRTEPSHEIVDITEDPLACVEINAALPKIRQQIKMLLTQGARTVQQRTASSRNVVIRFTPIDGVKWWLDNPPLDLELHERTYERTFAVPGDGFYQVNPFVAEKLVRTVVEDYLKDVEKAPDLLDLYCGVGVFGLSCRAHLPPEKEVLSPHVVGIESGRAAIACAKKNAAQLGVQANFFCECVGQSLARIKIGSQHTVIVDPPRGGMEANVPAFLARQKPAQIFYVSCDPATLVRDLASLGLDYHIAHVRLFDLFPRTARFESLVTLIRT